MPIDQVAELLVRWRGAGGMLDRARVLREGMQLLDGLDAAERRVLARSLGEQGAPHLAAQFEQRTGGAMNADQLWTVAEGLLSMEDHQVDQLAANLRDPGERERLLRQVVSHGVASFDPGSGAASDLRARLDDLPPPGGAGDLAAAHAGTDLGEQELGSQELGAIELGSQELGAIELGDAGIVDVGLHEPGTGPVGRPEVPTRTADRAGDGDEVLRPARSERPTRAARSGSSAAAPQPAEGDDLSDHRPEGLTADVSDDPVDAGTEKATDAEADVPTEMPLATERGIVASARATSAPGDDGDGSVLLARLREAETATARLRLLDPESLAQLDGATALAVLDALPDGWQRRRGALRLVDGGALPSHRLAEALGRFDRATDAVFVAGALIATGQVRAERFDGILPERAVKRLTARSER